MEIVLLSAVIVLGILQVLQLFKNCNTTDDIRLLQDNVNNLQSLNKVVYKNMIEDYRNLIGAHFYITDNICVKFRNDAVEHGWEHIYYHELPQKLEELKKLKDKLCDNRCPNPTTNSTFIDPRARELIKSMQELFEPVSNEELEKHLGEKELKKIRKQRTKK